ncbi:MAG TPA: CopG family transcriptional regulator [Candidatus Korarchaeota archaeon]|nr:CopG family transcriptional regulator [Candidatus Korarchaeota archaeon]
MAEKVSVQIPKELYDRIKKEYVDNGEFKSVEDFIKFVLKEVLSEEEQESVYTPEEEEEIKKRLRSLGYL